VQAERKYSEVYAGCDASVRTGNADGKGDTRRSELRAACQLLHVRVALQT